MDTVDQSLPKRMVESAISGLRPRTRNVVELIHLQEHSITETPQILGISTGAVSRGCFTRKSHCIECPCCTVSAVPIVPGKLRKEASQRQQR